MSPRKRDEVDLSNCKTDAETCTVWSRYLLEEVIQRREDGVQAVRACVFLFFRTPSGALVLPTAPHCFTEPLSPTALLEMRDWLAGNDKTLVCALFITLGETVEQKEGVQRELTSSNAVRVPLGVPERMLPPSGLYLVGVLDGIAGRTWIAPFDGESFGSLRDVQGVFGGYLTGHIPQDQN